MKIEKMWEFEQSELGQSIVDIKAQMKASLVKAGVPARAINNNVVRKITSLEDGSVRYFIERR